MPTLPYEPDLFPDTLLESPPTNAKWWAVYTSPRHEKAFMRQLQQLSVPHYGPMITKRVRSGRHVRKVFVPLFPGYVFVCGNEEQRVEALKTNCALRVIEVPDEAELIFDLRQVRQLILSDAPLTPEARL